MKSFKVILTLLAALTAASAQAQAGFSVDQIRAMLTPYASAADVVTLPDGRNVGFTCMGEGSPTVILIAGLGDFAGISWGNVQPEMAKTTRVCAWDRPGWGLSDGADGDLTVATTTDTLEAALATGKIPGPYVVVGHSLGGLESLLLADRHPEQVVAMVMVDPSVPDQATLMASVAPALAADSGRQGVASIFRQCAADIRSGAARAGGPDPNNCFQYPPFFPSELSAAFGAKVSNPIQYETMAAFIGNTNESFAAAVNSSRNYGDMPLIVLSATMQEPPPPGLSPEAAEEMGKVREAMNRAHDELAALSSRGVNARVPGANHYVQRTKPQVVIDAVEAVVAEARAARD
jgi:pimeloyl-ACP methyl ester carboxylesterase